MAELEVISPVHIGNGNEFTLIDFVMYNNKLIIINFDKLVDYCFEKKIPLVDEIEREKEHFMMEKFFKKYKLSPKDFVDYSVPMNIDSRNRLTKPKIKEFVKNANKLVYIPGSSIKGSIRTALLWYAIDKKIDKNRLDVYCENIRKNKRQNLKKVGSTLESEIFGKNANNDILRVLRVSDTANMQPKKGLEVNEIKIVGNKNSIPTYAECLKKGVKTSFDIRIDKSLLDEKIFEENGLKSAGIMNIDKIAEVCRNFSTEIIDKQCRYQLYDKVTKEYYSSLKEYAKNLNGNEILMNIGFGGGWYSKTIGLKIEKCKDFTVTNPRSKNFKGTIRYKLKLGKRPGSNYFSINFPKTRKVTINNVPLGWVKVRL